MNGEDDDLTSEEVEDNMPTFDELSAQEEVAGEPEGEYPYDENTEQEDFIEDIVEDEEGEQ